MVRWEPIYEVFIASPNDVKPERDILSKVIEAIDDEHTDESLRPIRWEDAFRDFSNPDAQAELNKLVHRCDLLVAVFGGGLGTATDRAASGAIEEIQESNQNVLLFLKQGNAEKLRKDWQTTFPKWRTAYTTPTSVRTSFAKWPSVRYRDGSTRGLKNLCSRIVDKSLAERKEPSHGLGRGNGS